jgi:hypothetical protein
VKGGKDTLDPRHLNPKKIKKTADTIAAVNKAVRKDACLTIDKIAAGNGVAKGTV